MSWKDYYTAITGRSASSEQASPSGTVYGTTPSRTSAVEDYYNEQMQQKQATDKMRQIINNERRIAEKEPAFVNPAEKKTPESGYLGWEQNEAHYRANKAQEAYDTALEKYGGNDKHPSVMAAKRSLDDANMMLSVYGKAKRAYDSQPHRVQKTITGAIQNSGAGAVEAGRVLYEGGVRGATAENERQLSEYRRQLEKAQENYNTALNKYGGDQNNVNVKAAKAIVDDIQRNIDVYGNVLQNTGLQDTVDRISGVSDRLAQSSAQNIAEAKKGLGKTGRFLVDAGVGAAQLATDVLVSSVTGIPASAVMAIRTFGAGSEEARQAGASYEQQAAYGAASAAVETLTEKIFDGVAGIYGKGRADEIVEKVVNKLNTDTGRTVARSVINAIGEGAEEIISDVVNPIIRAIYNGKSIGENYSEEQVSDWLYDGLVGAALGLAGSGVSIVTGADAKKNAELRSRDIDNAIELMTGKKAASEPQSVAEAQGDISTPPTLSNDAVARPVELNSAVNNNVEAQNSETQKNIAPNGTESTAVNDNPATHTAEENKIIADYKAAADENVISGIERARSLQDINYRNKFTVTLAETVGDRVVNLVKNATGIDVTGFKNQIKGNSIAHIDKRHGVNGTADHSMANIEDFGRINYVVENADRARLLSAGDVDSETWKLSREYRNADNSQAPLIRFEKRVDNTYYVVEAVPDSKANRMAVVSAYMETAKKEASSPKSVDAAEAAPRATPEASLEISETSDNSIPTSEENVNRGQAENSVNANPEKTAKELAEDAALKKAKADYQETVKRWYEQHPEADSIPVTSSLYNANDWIKGRVKALLQKYYDAEDFDEYVAGANKMAEKTYNMEENAEKNSRDAFSAAILDSKLKSEAKTEGSYTDESLLDDTYKAGKEAFSSREEPTDKSVGTRLPDEVLEMIGVRKYDVGVELEDQLRAIERKGKNARRAYEKAIELNDTAGAEREMTRIKSLRETYNTTKAKLSKYRNGSMSDSEVAELTQGLRKEKHTVKGSRALWESIAAKEAVIKAEAEKRRLHNSASAESDSSLFDTNENGIALRDSSEHAKDEVLKTARSMFDEWATSEEIFEATGLLVFDDGSVLAPDTGKVLYRPGSGESTADHFAKSTSKSGSTAGSANNAKASDADFYADERGNVHGTDASQNGSNAQDANSNYNADNANHSTGSNKAERVYVDENGNEYDPKTGYTTRTAEEVQAERDAHISDDLYYTLRAEDRLTPDNAKEWAQWQRRREERQNAQKTPVSDEAAWKDAEAEFGGANHDAIHKATQRAVEFETFLESDAFTSRLTDEQHTKVSDSVTEFKNKLAGLGDGHTSFAEFAEYYKAMKDSRILGDLYSERVNEQVQLARELAEEAYRNPIPYNVEKYRHAAVKAAQMTSHYIEKASKVRAELDELNNAVKENGSKRKPTELGREVERGEKGKSLREKAAAKFIRWQIMPRQMFQMIDGFKFWEKGAGYRMADTIESAAVKNQTTLVEADNFFADVVKMKGYGDFATGKTKTSVRLGGETLTMSEAVSLYKAIKTMGGPDAYRVQNIEGFALKNGDNKPHMIKADPTNISELYSALQTVIAKNEVASAYVKAFDSMSEKLGKETQDIAKAIDGVDNELFKPGDYFPLTYARAEDVNSEWDKANSKDFGVPDFKNLKERTRTAGGYVNIAPVVEVTDGYIRRAADYIAFGELADTFGIMDYMHTFGTPTLVDSVKQNMGSEYGAWMENYVKDVQDINQTRAKSRDNWWQKLNHNFQTAVLIGNPGTPFKQKGSMWLAMSELDPRAVAKAAVTSLNPGNQQMKAARNNPLLQFRAKGNIDSSITDALQDQNTLFSKMAAKSKVLKSIQNWIPAADVREVSKVYLASCYDVQMKNPGIDVNSTKFKEMVDETFQRASMRTQSQYTMNMRDEISRGDSALLKALTMFQTQQRTTANSMFTAINEAIAAKGTEHAAKANKALKNAAAGFFASNVAYAAMDVLAKGLRHKLKQFRDDDEEQQIDAGEVGLELLKSFFEGAGGTVIFGDDVTNLVESIISGETFYENGIGAIGAIEDAASAFWNLTQNPSADNIRKTAGGFANLAGIPLNNAYTLLNSMGMYTLDVINAMSRSKESGNILNELLKGTSAADIAGKKKAGLYSISDDPADDALKIFDSIKKAVDKLPPDQFTYTDENGDEVSYELTKADKEQYRKDAEASYNSGMDALLKAFGYDKLDDKAKEDVEKQIKGYAKDAAEQGYLDSKGLDYDTGASAWAEAVPEEDVPGYLVSKKILDADGKKTDYDAIDYLIGGFSKIPSSVQTQLKDDGVNVNALLYAKLFGIGSEAWYSNKGATKDAEESFGSSDVAKAIAVYNNMEGKSDEQILNAIKTQVLPDAGGKQSATVRRIEAYNTIAGNDADLGSWLNLAAALKDADVNGSVSKDDVYTAWANMGLSAHETYAGITRSDFYNIVKSGAKSYAVNEDYATQVDKGYASIVPAKEEADPTFSGSVRNHQADGSAAKSTSIFTMEDYYRALGLLK